ARGRLARVDEVLARVDDAQDFSGARARGGDFETGNVVSGGVLLRRRRGHAHAARGVVVAVDRRFTLAGVGDSHLHGIEDFQRPSKRVVLAAQRVAEGVGDLYRSTAVE